MLSKGGKTRSLTVHYIFAMGLYRALYIPNWIWRYSTEDKNWTRLPFSRDFCKLCYTLISFTFTTLKSSEEKVSNCQNKKKPVLNSVRSNIYKFQYINAIPKEKKKIHKIDVDIGLFLFIQ